MKPGKKDIAVQIKISGRQLEELQKHTWLMCEAFGLDTKIGNYKGVRPISFYSWDLDCLLTVLKLTLNDAKADYQLKAGQNLIWWARCLCPREQTCDRAERSACQQSNS